MDPHDVAALTELEESLWRPATRFDREHLERVLAPDFAEFGASGRCWSRAEIVDMAQSEFSAVLPLPHLRVEGIGPDTALLTYRSDTRRPPDAPQAANRSSIWTRTDGRWRLRFHQGTPTG